MELPRNDITSSVLPAPAADVIRRVLKLVSEVVGAIVSGKANVEHVECFVDWFLDLSYDDREEIFGDNEWRKPLPLKLISTGQKLWLSPLSGSKAIYYARNLFSYVDLNFKRCTGNGEGIPTPGIAVLVYKVERRVSIRIIFDSLSQSIKNLFLTQHQILNFINLHRKWLPKGSSTFFLFKDRGDTFVANVDCNSDGDLTVFVNRFEDSTMWMIATSSCIVVPSE